MVPIIVAHWLRFHLPHRTKVPEFQELPIHQQKHVGMIPYTNLVGRWATPLKNMEVSWDDDIPNISQYDGKKKAMFQTTNQ